MSRLSLHSQVFVVLSALLLTAAGCAAGSSAEKESTERAPLTESSEQSATDGTDTASDSESAEEGGDVQQDDQTSSETASEVDSDMAVAAVGPVAVIDGHEIGADEFNAVMARKLENTRRVNYPLAQMYKSRTLKQVVDDYLIARELERAGIQVSDAEVEQEFESFESRFPDKQAYEHFVERAGVTKPQLKVEMRKSLRLKKYLRDQMGVEVTDKQARDYYDANSQTFEHPDEVRARHILVKTSQNASEQALADARARAQELSERAKSGEDFAELAKEHSEGPSARRGGDLGFFPRKRMVEPFSTAAFGMKKGEVSGPVKTRFGFHVIKVLEKKPAHTTPFVEAKPDIVERLERQEMRRSTDELTQTLRNDAKIVEMPENIEVRIEKSTGEGSMGISPEKLREIKKEMKEKQSQEQGKD